MSMDINKGGQVIPKEEHKAVPKEIERPKPKPPKETEEEEKDRSKCELYPDECE